LSDDEMHFDEVAYREPERLCRPDLDRDWACIAYEVPGPNDLDIYLDRKPADAIERHALRDTSVELGGILLGKECVDEETGEPFVWITEALEAKHYENTQASFTYTHDSWQEITRERDQKHPELDIVGWYHTHPDFGIFLSSHDLFIHHNFFNQRLQVAYVVDPIRQTRGFFQWRGTEMDQVGGFYLISHRNERQALARLVNDLENIPNTEGGGSGFSPRLEAELIAMLTRPHQAPTVIDRSQSAAVFSVIGVLMGSLLMGAVMWLNSLSQTIKDQVDAVNDLKKAVAKSEDAQARENDATRVARKNMDSILNDIPSDKLSDMLKKSVEEREKARQDLAVQRDLNTRLERDAKRQETLLREQAGSLKETLEKREKDWKTSDVANVEKIDTLTKQLKDFDEYKTGVLARKYQSAWYVAAVALVGCVLLTLSLIAAIARNLPPEPPLHEERPHSIS
jgi:proteasome lid subunit RPN8/RPN11